MKSLVRLFTADTGESGETPSLFHVPIETWTFPGGEPHCRINEHVAVYLPKKEALIDARIADMDGLMTVLLLVDVLRQHGVKSVSLYCPYFPGARMDRVYAYPAEPLSARVFARLVNGCGFKGVLLVDPHSTVTPALVERARELDPFGSARFMLKEKGYRAIVCPDQGAERRTQRAAVSLGIDTVISARKHRDFKSGKLSGFSIQPLERGHYLMLDDICDGGRTFLGIADAGGGDGITFDLFVTHGIFSQGIAILKSRFGEIITTDSYPSGVEGVRVVDVFKAHEKTIARWCLE